MGGGTAWGRLLVAAFVAVAAGTSGPPPRAAAAPAVRCAATLGQAGPGQTVCFGGDPVAGLSAAALTPSEAPVGDRTLLFSDDPEYVPGPGILYQDVVGPGSAGAPSPDFRLYAYAVNPAGASVPLHVGVVATDVGSAPATVTVTRWAVVGPSADYLAVGRAASSAFLGAAPTPVTWTLQPGESAFLDAGLGIPPLEDRALGPGQAANAIFDATTTGPLQVTVAASRAPIAAPTFFRGLPVLASARTRPGQLPMRGTFPSARVVGTYRVTLGGGGALVVHVADQGRYLWGVDAVDGGRRVEDYGDYGVVYEEDLAVAAASEATTRFAVVVLPRGGDFATAVSRSPGLGDPGPVAGMPVPFDNVFLPPNAYGAVLGAYCIPPGGTAEVDLQWMPAAGSFLPVDLWLVPETGSLAGLPGAAGCAPVVASASPGTVAPGTTVTLTGRGFGGTPGAVSFAAPGAPPVVVPGSSATWSDTVVQVSVPRSLGPGPVSVSVYDGRTGLASAPVSLTVLPPPNLEAVAPGSAEPGAPLVLTGSGFGPFGAVRFAPPGGVPVVVPATAWSDGAVRVAVPLGLAPGTVQVAVYDGETGLLSSAVGVDVGAAPAVLPGPLPPAEVGVAYATTLRAAGGTPPYTWSAVDLPAGLTLTPEGRLVGTPAAAGTATVLVLVRDVAGGAGVGSLPLHVAAPPPPAPSPSSGPGLAPLPAVPARGEATAEVSAAAVAAALRAAPRGPVGLVVAATLTDRATVALGRDGLRALARAGRPVWVRLGSAAVGLPPADLRQALQAGARGLRIGWTVRGGPLVARDAERPAGASYAVDVAWVGAPGAPRLAAPLALSLPLPAGAPAPLVGCYLLGPRGPAYVPTAVAAPGAPSVTCLAPAPGAYALFADRVRFADAAGSWEAQDVAVAAAHHLVQGEGGDRFAPGAPVTRAAFATMLAEALALPEGGVGTLPRDVSAHAWYAPAVAAVLRAGLLAPVAPDLFDPLAPVPRWEAAAAVGRALGYLGVAGRAASSAFRDAPEVPAAARAAVAEAVAAHVVRGVGDGALAPGAPITRAQAAALLVRLLALGLPGWPAPGA
jgi:hypothetical protein